METTIVYSGNIGIMEKKMGDFAGGLGSPKRGFFWDGLGIWGLVFPIWGFGFRV